MRTSASAARQFRLYAAPIADAGGPAAGGAVLVASDTTDISNTINHLGFRAGLIGAAVALLAAVVGGGAHAAAGCGRSGGSPPPPSEIERTADPSRRLPASRPVAG